MKFSPRLRALYDACEPGHPLADLCCDHGYLGIHAYASKLFPEILFVDQAEHGMQILKQKFAQYADVDSRATQVRFLTSDAGQIKVPLQGTVVIAGVGGVNMMKILSELEKRGMLQARSLILAPHRHRHLYEVEYLFNFRKVSVTEITEKSIQRPIFVFKKIA